MLTLFLKAGIGLFISDLKKPEAISDLFPLLAEKFEREDGKDCKTAMLKENGLQKVSPLLILSVTFYITLSTSASQSTSSNETFPSGPRVRVLPRAEFRGWG